MALLLRLASGRKKRTFDKSICYDKANKNDRMFPEKMNKYAVRKEIAALIDSIKTHSDTIGTRKQIPQIELELILHKIEKLYQKSIVFNYLNSIDGGLGLENPEVQLPAANVQQPVTPTVVTPVTPEPEKQEPVVKTFSAQPLATGLDELANLIDQYDVKTVTPEIIPDPVPEKKPEPVKTEPLPEIKKEPVAESDINRIKPEPVITPKKEETPPVTKSSKTYPPVKSLMGFNDKFLFMRSLFGNDSAVFEEALKQIDGCSTFEEASAFVSVLRTEMKWKADDEVAESFIQLIRRRYS